MVEAAHEFAVPTTAVASRADAEGLAHALVEARLAGCVQIIAIDSVYAWRGDIEQAKEQLLVAKIRLADFASVEAMIRTQHGYDVPEIIAVPLVSGSHDYLAWLSASTTR